MKKVAIVTAIGTLILLTIGTMTYQLTDIGTFIRKRSYVAPRAKELGLATTLEDFMALEGVTTTSNGYDDLPGFELPNGISSTISNQTLLEVWQKNRGSVPNLLSAFRRSKHFYYLKTLNKDATLWKCAAQAALNKAIEDKDLETTKDIIELLQFVEEKRPVYAERVVDGFIQLAATKNWQDPKWLEFAAEAARNNPVNTDVIGYLKYKHLQTQGFTKNTVPSQSNPEFFIPFFRTALDTAISEFYIKMVNAVKDIRLVPGKETEYIQACMDALKKEKIPYNPKSKFNGKVQQQRDKVCTVDEFLFVLQQLKIAASDHDALLKSLDAAQKLPTRNDDNLALFVKSLRKPFDGGKKVFYSGAKTYRAQAVIDPIIDLKQFGQTPNPHAWTGSTKIKVTVSKNGVSTVSPITK